MLYLQGSGSTVALPTPSDLVGEADLLVLVLVGDLDRRGLGRVKEEKSRFDKALSSLRRTKKCSCDSPTVGYGVLVVRRPGEIERKRRSGEIERERDRRVSEKPLVRVTMASSGSLPWKLTEMNTIYRLFRRVISLTRPKNVWKMLCKICFTQIGTIFLIIAT